MIAFHHILGSGISDAYYMGVTDTVFFPGYRSQPCSRVIPPIAALE